MIIYSAHIDIEEKEPYKSCSEKCILHYGDDYIKFTKYPDGFPLYANMGHRYNSDIFRIWLLSRMEVAGWLDADAYPTARWEPPRSGVWLCYNPECFDWWAIMNVNRKHFFEDMVEYFYSQKEIPRLTWPIDYFNKRRKEINVMPQGIFYHHYFTLCKGRAAL